MLEMLQEDQEYDVILCDLMMPEFDGPMFYAALQAWPTLQRRVVFCSGGAFTPRVQDFVRRLDNRLVEKPVSGEVLTRVLTEVANLD